MVIGIGILCVLFGIIIGMDISNGIWLKKKEEESKEKKDEDKKL